MTGIRKAREEKNAVKSAAKNGNPRFIRFALLLFLFILPVFCSCAGVEEETQDSMYFRLSRDEITLCEGEEYILTLIKTPADGKITPVKWRVQDPRIASAEGGKIVAIACGETFVSAQTKEYTFSCKVTVVKQESEKGEGSRRQQSEK